MPVVIEVQRKNQLTLLDALISIMQIIKFVGDFLENNLLMLIKGTSVSLEVETSMNKSAVTTSMSVHFKRSLSSIKSYSSTSLRNTSR